ncbi:hypothetical protein D3C81_2077640 [compost metagenome]
MLVDAEQLAPLAATYFHRDDLLREAAFLDGMSGTALFFHGEFVLHLPRDAIAGGDVLRSHAHVDALERVVQDA